MKKINPKLPIVVNKKIPPKEGFFFVMVGGGPVVPIDINGLIFWTKAEILPKDQFNTPNFQLNNEVGSPDLQLKTGSGLDFLAATSDYVNHPDYTITGDFTLTAFVNFHAGSSAVWAGVDANGYGFLVQPTVPRIIVRIAGGSQVFNDSSMTTLGYRHIAVVRESTNLHLYLDGILRQTITGVPLTGFILSRINSWTPVNFLADSDSSNYAAYSSALTVAQIFELYNNPQRFIELSRQYGADRIYPLSEGSFLNNSIVYDYSGNNQHGTFLTSATVGYDAKIDSLITGVQKGLHSYNRVGGRDILSTTPSGTTDILGNAITNLWESGRINFGDYVHGGGTIGSTINSLDAANRTIIIGFHYKVTDAVQSLLINRSSVGDGFTLLITSVSKLRYDNKIASVNQLRIGLATLIDGNKYIAAITHASDGTAQLYLMNVTIDEFVMSADNTSANLGAVGTGSEIPVIGNLTNGISPIPFPITPPLVFAKVLTLSELNDSANFLKTTI